MTNTSAAASYWFPKTKLVPPQLGEDLYFRPTLVASLQHAVRTNRLTLLAAPAGSGKTTLLAQLVNAEPEFPLAWITLDAEDNDPVAFLQLVVSSLQEIFPGFGETVQALLAGRSDSGLQLRRVTAAIINELLDRNPSPFGLVLDDLHIVDDPAIFQCIDTLIENLPPCMHVLIATRHEPAISIARMRARGYLTEFHLDQLRFQEKDIENWLQETLHLELDRSHLHFLSQQTGGWITGVRLLLLSLRNAPDKTERDDWFLHLEQAQRHIFDFLLEEVFQQQTDEMRSFLMQTSILVELTPQICQQVTGKTNAGDLLEKLYKSNLFLTLNNTALPLETEDALPRPRLDRPTYRYHAIFSEFLQEQLRHTMSSELEALYSKAAQAQSSLARAVHYYLAIGLWEPACKLIETLGREILSTGYIGQLTRWIRSIPDVHRQQHPWLNLILSADAVQRGHFEQAGAILETTLPVLADQQDTNGYTEALTQLGEIYTCLAQTEKAQPVLEQLIERTLPSETYIKARINQIWTMFYQGNWHVVEAELPVLLRSVQSSDKAEDWLSLILSLGPQYAYIQNGIALLGGFCLAALKRNHEPMQAAANAYLGYLRALQGDLVEARRLATEARHLCDKFGGFAHLDIFINHVLLFDALHRGEYEYFHSYLEQRLGVITGVLTQRQFLAAYLYMSALGAFRGGQGNTVAVTRKRLRQEQIAYEVPDAVIAHHLLDSLAARHQRDFANSENSLKKALALQQNFKHSLLMTNARGELAVLYWEMGKRDQALKTLSLLLDQAAQDSMPGLIYQEGNQIVPLLEAAQAAGVQRQFTKSLLLHMTGNTHANATSDSPKRILLKNGEHLSDRELEVLRLIADGLSNHEIGECLFISAGTAKRHSIHIYRKLGVNSRTQAIARAQEWELL